MQTGHQIFKLIVTTLCAQTFSSLWAKPALQVYEERFELPTYIAQAPGQVDQLWVLEKKGTIQTLDKMTGEKSAQPLLDIRDEINITFNEQGLLGLAFCPDFKNSKRFYLYFTDLDGDSRLSRFTLSSSGKETKRSQELLLSFGQDYKNHNGGFLDFGPDGMLYLGTGDGGSANDPKNRAQDLESYLGKLLRLDVSTPEGFKVPSDNPFVGRSNAKPEIFAYGLRNPWRCSFDRETGDLFIGDVGQNHWEIIHHYPKDAPPGANFGWRLREGKVATPKKGVGGPPPSDHRGPIYVYKHGNGPDEGISVTGGYVYRGPVAGLGGHYFFADYGIPRIWSLDINDGYKFHDWTKRLPSNGVTPKNIASFGEDHSGDLYIVDHTGLIFRLVER